MTHDKTLCTNEACPLRHNCLRGAVLDAGGYEVASVHPFVYNIKRGGCADLIPWPLADEPRVMPVTTYTDVARVGR